MIANIHAIGDLQGCRGALDRLLDAIDSAAADGGDAPGELWFAGDLVNRGPDSLGVLRRVRALGERAVAVLGNHDLHLLAVAAGLRKPHRGDTFDAILAAPDADALIDWVRHRPLAHLAHGHLMVHAGVLPGWRPDEVVALAGEVESALRGARWRDFLAGMYGNRPAAWDPALTGADRLRVVVNALTRIRFATPDGTMEFETKDAAGAAPAGHLPWFDIPGRCTAGITVVCGHWSTLGLVSRPDLLALDTGCVWGGCLTAVRLGDRRVLQVDCSGER